MIFSTKVLMCTELHSMSLQDSTTLNPICFMAKAHHLKQVMHAVRLSHLKLRQPSTCLSKNNNLNEPSKLKFTKIICVLLVSWGKQKESLFFIPKEGLPPSSKKRRKSTSTQWTYVPNAIESINGKKYFLLIVDDFSHITWTTRCGPEDKHLEFLLISSPCQRGLHAQSNNSSILTKHGNLLINLFMHTLQKRELDTKRQLLEHLNKTAFVERRNRNSVEAARDNAKRR
ncbi:hypothetical protein Tco_0232790 [Tanacetum coccineum]